ncbi:MAG: hypothetical protein ACUVTZ_00465 [Armatimonadota bacterium]
MRSAVRDLLLVALGAAIGYVAAPQGTRVRHLSDLPKRAEEYYRGHMTEVVVWGILVAVIVYLLTTRPRSSRGRK